MLLELLLKRSLLLCVIRAIAIAEEISIPLCCLSYCRRDFYSFVLLELLLKRALCLCVVRVIAEEISISLCS